MTNQNAIPKPNRISVPLGNGMTLIAEPSTDPSFPAEIFVSVMKDGVWLQDLAYIGSEYHYDNGMTVFDDTISLRVWTNPDEEDWQIDHRVPLREEN